MALIAKIDAPLEVAEDRVTHIHARPYKSAAAQTGEEVFVWISEKSGGHGLTARGKVIASRVDSFPNKSGPGEHKELVLDVQIVSDAPVRALSLEQIAPLRDSNKATAEAAVAKVLYNHALNKITSIESEVADFVRSHFEE